MFRLIFHGLLHVIAPGVVARLGWPTHWRRAWLVMLLTLLVDLDHLLADPVFDPDRCSIGFHPLHSYAAIGIYVLLFLLPRARVVAVGLLVHMGVDTLDCWWMAL